MQEFPCHAVLRVAGAPVLGGPFSVHLKEWSQGRPPPPPPDTIHLPHSLPDPVGVWAYIMEARLGIFLQPCLPGPGHRAFLLISSVFRGASPVDHSSLLNRYEDPPFNIHWLGPVNVHTRWMGSNLSDTRAYVPAKVLSTATEMFGDPEGAGLWLFSRLLPRLYGASVRRCSPVHWQTWVRLGDSP